MSGTARRKYFLSFCVANIRIHPADAAHPFYLALMTSSLLSSPPPSRILNCSVVTREVREPGARPEGSTGPGPQDRADGGAGDKIGNRWIVGFDKERIEKELGLS